MRFFSRSAHILWLGVLLAVLAPLRQAVAGPVRFLGKEDILLYGIGLKVEPAQQTVPKDIATIVSTYLKARTDATGLPPFSPDAEVRATLVGPSFTSPRELVVRPNTPFQIPALSVPGVHSLENIRLVSNGEVLLYGSPQSVRIEVIDRLLVTQVTARPLSAAEIREAGIVFDKRSYQAYNFSAAFAIEDKKINLNFPVLLPSLQGAADAENSRVTLQTITGAQLPTLQTIIPDTLRIQTQVPNLSVVGFTLKAPTLQGQQLLVPPIPGVVVIPGDIGFLNQFFSVMLMVGNVAPAGSNLVVSELKAEIVLPPGKDGAVGSSDDPLLMARTANGVAQTIAMVVQPGFDAKLGTADDIATIGPGETGNAEYLVEGRREGTHVVEMQISGILNGLPVGPVPITGRAAGSVLVRNPTFTLTFTHPEVVSAGEPYTLDVTVTNTSASPANLVTLNLYPRNVSGATIVGEAGRQIESIAPGDSAAVSFDLISRITGKVTAATLDSDENVAGRFALKTTVGELGVPLSPDSLVLPKEASALPKGLRDATIALLGKAWAVATAPPAAMPPDLSPFSKKIVIDRAVETAEAGLRVTLEEPLVDSAAQLVMDFMGSNFARLSSLVKPVDLAFEQANFRGFDELRRKSIRGDAFASAVADVLAGALASEGVPAFHTRLAQHWSYRPGHVSVFVSGIGGGPSPYALAIVDANGRTVGGTVNGKIVKEIPFGDLLPFAAATGGISAELAVLAAPSAGALKVRLTPRAGVTPGAPVVLSIVLPDGANGLRHVVYQLGANEAPAPLSISGAPNAITFEVEGATSQVPPATSEGVVNPAPTVISVIQQADADQIRCDPEKPGFRAGRIVAVLFSEEVTPQSVQDKLLSHQITNYLPGGNTVVGVALQPGRRIAFLALRDPIGPFIQRSITISNIADPRGNVMAPWTGPIETTVDLDGAVVSGRVFDASGKPMPFADVRLFYLLDCGIEPSWVGISAKQADASGAYSWDYVAKPMLNRILAVDTATDEFRNVQYNVQRQGQQLNVDIVFLGRGSIQGIVRSEQGTPLFDTVIRVTSLTDQSQYSARSDANGRYAIARVPVGNVFIEAVNVAAHAQVAQADYIPSAGSVVQRDLTLLDVEQRKITVKHGTIHGHVYRADGITPAAGLPVFAYYRSNSQTGVACPGANPCPIARTTTAADGAFSFVDITAGELTLTSFDQTGLSMAQVGLILAPDATASANLLLSGGLGTVNGRVLTADGTPVNGAQVGGGLSLTTTNALGEFTLSDVPVGHREIVAVSTALGATGKSTVDIVMPGEVVSTTIVFAAQGSVAGTVVQADGTTPVAGVTVYVFRSSTSGGGYEILGQAPTNAQGGYQIDHVPAGSYKVSAFTAGFTDGNVTPAVVKFNGQVARADIRFRGGAGKITGIVYNDNGNTPLEARVGVSGDRVRVAGGLVGVGFERVENFAIADSDLTTGKFTLSGILVGPFTLNAVGQFSPDPISVEGLMPSPGATVNVELRLQATSQIRGVVTNPNGTPVKDGIVVHYKSEAYKLICTEDASGEQECDSIPQGIQEENVVTDTDGRFWLPVVNAGSFSLSVEDLQTGKVGLIKGSVRPGETAEVSVRLLAQGSVQVRVLGSDTTTPIPGAKVVISQLGFPKVRRELVADANGIALFTGGDGLTEGDYVVEATDLRNGFAGRASGRITVDGAEVITKVYLFNATGTVHGIIYNADGFTPVANADVVVANAQGPLAFAVSGPDGTYSLDMIPLGDVHVEIFDARSGRRGNGSGYVNYNGHSVPINVVLSAVGVVKGIVLDGTTRLPLKGWTVTLQQQSASGVTLPVLTSTTGVDGRFLIPGAARGTFALRAVKVGVNGIGQAAGALDQEGQVVDVPMLVTVERPLSGSITGTVLTSGGAPAANTIVEVSLQSGLPVQLTTDQFGTFSLGTAPLGRFTVRARSQVSHDAGSVIGEVRTDGEVAAVVVAMAGVAQVSGTVERADGSPVAGAQVMFEGFPATACGEGGCTSGADSQGRFSFIDQPARSFTITATDPISQLKGTAGGPLTAGENRIVRIVLAPTAALSGRVLRAAGQPASGIVAELIVSENTPAERRLYKQTAADGTFVFPAAPLEPYRLVLADPIGSGIASRSGQLTAAQPLGDIVLDEAAPSVASLTPLASATGVPLNQAITIVFTEPVQPGTVSADHIKLQGPNGAAIAAVLDVTANDTKVVVTPLAALAADTRYTLRVTGVTDRVGKVMAADYTAAFTTVDVTAPVLAEASPAADAGGVPIYTPIRIRFSEPIDPATFAAPPITLTGLNGAVAGRLDYLLGNTVMVYTPNLPLAENTVYQVKVAAASDIAGNTQASATNYQFSTTDKTPPQLAGLVADNNGKVIENGLSTVSAELGTSTDVRFVDFYVNGSLAFVDRAAPFAITFQATPQLGAPGSTITVSAIATDTSGNRSIDPVSVGVLVLPDQLPTVAITSPGAISAKNGDHVVVTVRATDDLGVKTMAYRAQTGNPADAATRAITPVSLDRTETFAFDVPANAAPGSVIAIDASAVDTFGHVTTATPVHVTVLDAVSPVVTITGATTGAQVQPGQQTTVVVTATDQGGVSGISFSASGVVTKTESRTVSPSQSSVVTSFTVTVPTTAQPGQSLNLDATATDKAGNAGVAARVILPVADMTPPVITLDTENGTLNAVPGRSVKVIANATDETGVTRVNLSTTGAVTFADAKLVNPPLNTAVVSFDIPVPANATPGTTIQVQATATDVTDQTSAPAALTLTVTSPVDVTLPASEIVDAGQTRDVPVQLGAPAPAEGITVAFTSSDTSVVTVPPSIAFASGESSKTLTLTGVAGGTAQVRALVGGVERATMTVTVAGGIVSGIVRNSMLVPVAGAQVTITSGLSSFPAITDGNGAYRVSGVAGPHVSVRVLDPVTKLYGHSTGSMAHTQGVVTVNVVLIPAGAIAGHVVDAAGAVVGAGVKVEILSAASANAIATTFTGDDGSFEFPLVTLGNYTLQATSGLNRGRASVSLAISGQQLETTIVYLGAGTVNGAVRLSGVAVPNAELKFESWSIFGASTPIVVNAQPDGTFSFSGVPIGNFTVTAEDPATTQKGSATGEITVNGQTVTANVNLASYGAVTGFVHRSDGTTIVAGAVVTIDGLDYRRQTTTGADGRYRFDVVPLGAYALAARDAGTRGTGSGSVTVDTHQGTKTVDITFLPQGRLLVKVESASGEAVASAFVRVDASSSATAQDSLTATTGADGTVLIDHVLAGSYSVNATFGALGGAVSGSLASNELKNVTVSLQPTGSITGTVFGPNGQTPAAGVRVTVVAEVTVTTNAEGVYRVDGLVPGGYDIAVYDAASRVRAKTDVFNATDDIVISTNGQVATRDFTMIGLGTVTGRVVFASNGQSASNMPVSLSAQAPGFQSVRSMRTDAGGFYRFEYVPVGAVTVVVSDTVQKLYGESTGVLPQDGAEVQVDISLTSNAITLPHTVWDANNKMFDVQAGGQVNTGSHALFNGDGVNNRGAFALDIVNGAATTRFAGGEVPTIEDGNREIVVRQENVFGLSVTRKIFVPRAGYFARYLEILRNPTASPVTVDLKVTGNLGGAGLVIDNTSSGDATLDISNTPSADTWLVAGRSDTIGAAFVFDGAGAADRVDEATFTPLQSAQALFVRVVYGWNTITVPAGGTVAVMHFGVQQLTRAAATASAQRLASLPPEAMAGLSTEELAAIRNFAAPADGQSPVAPLPALTGSVTGKTLEADSTTAIASASVKLRSEHPLFGATYSAASSSDGSFTFTGALNDNGNSVAIPVTAFTLSATYPFTQVQSPVVTGTIDPQTKTAVTNVVFDNTGALFGNVLRHTGAAVVSGTVAIVGGSPSTTRSVSIANDSTYRAGGLPPGEYTLTASTSDPKGTGLTGLATATVVAGPAARADITIEATGALTGVVKRSSGTPASGITVKVMRTGFSRQMNTDSGGVYTFAAMPTGTFTVRATEPGTGITTTATVTIVADQTTTQDLQLVTTGRVVGVVKLNGTPQAGMQVELRSTNPSSGGFLYATTDAGGAFTFNSVPVGTFTVAVHDTVRQLYGEASGRIESDGQEVSTTIDLTNNAISLPAYRYDASNFIFDIRAGGQTGSGTNSAFGTDANEGAAQLQLDNGSGLVTFTGAQVGTHEDGEREIATRQTNIAGVNVTRKVFVPTNGYFARYLEILSNPSASPVTLKVTVRSRLGANGFDWSCSCYRNRAPVVVTTSSGDATFDVTQASGGDTWLTLGHGDDVDPFESSTLPPVAFVFGGADASLPANAGAYTTPDIGLLSYEWQNVTIPSGGTVAFMHFVVQQTSRAGALAAADRLAQLPPEALSGLSEGELAAIKNFAVSPTGGSTLEPLPSLTAIVQGRTLASDGTTVVPGATVKFKSANVLFGRQHSVTAPATGAFTFTGTLNASGSSVAIPVAPYTLTATHPKTSAPASASGSFEAGQTTATTDLTFAGTGIVSALVTTVDGTPIAGAYLRLEPNSFSTTTDAAGRGAFTGLQPGGYSMLTSRGPASPQSGSTLVVQKSVTATADQTTTVTLAYPAIGQISGRLLFASGATAPNRLVTIIDPATYWSRSVLTTAQGAFLLTDLPAGEYRLQSTHPTNLAVADDQAVIAGGQVTTQDLTLPGDGTATVTVFFARGVVAPGSRVDIKHGGSGGYFKFAGTTNASGQVTITNVPVGAITVRAFYPGDTNYWNDAVGSLDTNGGTASVTVTLPALGAVHGTLRKANGTPVPGFWVQLRKAGTNDYFTSVNADQNGNFRFNAVPLEQALHLATVNQAYTQFWTYGSDFTLHGDGEDLAMDISMPAVATVTVQVRRLDGSGWSGLTIESKNSAQTYFSPAGYTNAAGDLNITPIGEGAFTIRVRDTNTGVLIAEQSGTIAAAQDATTVPFPMTVTAAIGTVKGTVFAADGVRTLSNVTVEIYDVAEHKKLKSMKTAGDGTYQFTDVLSGLQGLTVRVTAPHNPATVVDMPAVITTPGETVTVDVTLPVTVGTITGVVRAATGNVPLANVAVRVRDTGNPAGWIQTTTNASGAYQFTDVAFGPGFTIVALASGKSIENTGSFSSQGQLVTMDFTLPLTVGHVLGTVYAGDEATALRGVVVQVRSSEGAVLATGTTTAIGQYSFTNVYAPGPFVVVAGAASMSGTSATGEFTTSGESVTRDVVIPASVIKGRVTTAGGQGVTNLSLFVETSDRRVLFPYASPSDGTYVVIGAPTGAIRVTAQDSLTGIQNVAVSAVSDIATPVLVDIALPGTGTVTGRVLDRNGSAVAGTQVRLRTESLAYEVYEWTNSQGVFTLTGIPAGAVWMIAEFYDSTTDRWTFLAGAGTVVVGGSVTIDLTPIPVGTVSGHVRNSDGTPVAAADVRVESFYNDSTFDVTTTSDATGSFSIANVPSGPVSLTAVGSSMLGKANGTLAPNGTLTLDVIGGTAVTMNYTLTGGDGFRYELFEGGELKTGGNADGTASDPYYYSVWLEVNGSYFYGSSKAAIGIANRQLTIGPTLTETLAVSRSVYVPDSGGFARYLDVLYNPSSIPRTAHVYVGVYPRSSGRTHWVVAPASTGYRYAVSNESFNATPSQASLGYVMAGSGTVPVPVTVMEFTGEGSNRFAYQYTVTVPPRQKVALMHFQIQRDPTDTAGAQSAAASLSALTDPNALTGLTAEEKAMIVNFVITP